MAIQSIPLVIVGGSNKPYNGVVYGLNLQMGYSSAPSKLKISIINKTGDYTLPELNRPLTVSFGDFSFTGIIWSYEIREDLNQKTLQIEVIDNSIILDRHYVILWKRGFFNDMGKSKDIQHPVKIQDSVLLPKLVDGQIQFIVEKLGEQSIKRTIYSAGKISGNIIYLGTEEVPNTRCDIPETKYTFDELKNLVSTIVPGQFDLRPPENYKATHEGTLREVLQAWAQDCGSDFFWNYSSNTIQFYSISKGIGLIPKNLSDPNLIEQSYSKTMEGTFLQQAFAYTAKPKEQLETRDFYYETEFEIPIFAFPIKWFLKNNDTLQSLNLPKEGEGTTEDPNTVEKNIWGGRSETDFLSAAFLGYMDQNLRDLYCLTKGFFFVCGISGPMQKGSETFLNPVKIEGQDKKKIVDQLKQIAPGDYNELAINSPDLKNHDIYDGNVNEGLNSKWKEIEQDILRSYGSLYRHNVLGGSYYYCSETMNTSIVTTITPEPSETEPNSKDFEGLRVFSRSGRFSHDPNQALAELGLDTPEVFEALSKLTPRILDSVSYKLKGSLTTLKGDKLIIVPNESLVSSLLGSLSVDITYVANNMELILSDVQKAQSSNNEFNCTFFDENLKKSKCKTLLEEATEKEYDRLKIAKTISDVKTPLVNGLRNRMAKAAKIKFGKKTIKLCAPSDGSYSIIGKTSISAQKVINDDKEKIFFAGKSESSADDVSVIDVLIDNLTNEEDVYMIKRSKDLPVAVNLKYNTALERSSFKFVGLPKLNLSPKNGLVSMDISYSSEGFITTLEFNSRPPKRTTVDRFLDKVHSQLNRSTYNVK